jgi:starch-binding outer membrane protein, SusD/RagB family
VNESHRRGTTFHGLEPAIGTTSDGTSLGGPLHAPGQPRWHASAYSASGVRSRTGLPRTAAFDSAIVSLTTAIEHAGSIPVAADYRMAAVAGLAQAYVGLGQWDKAVAEAAKVPTSFVHSAIYNRTADNNVIYVETHQRAELGVYGTLASRFDPQEARAGFTKCGVYTDPNDPSKGVTKVADAGCTSEKGADGLTAHWRQEKYPDYGSDIPVAKGTEMRLIEAEAALRNGDLGTFTAKINEVRAFYGIDPIEQPATAGALEYPNALDDGWSILGAERWLTLWLEGRRLWDLYRWDHPFLEGGTVIYPAEPLRAWCMPLPAIECQLNQNLRQQTVQTSTGGTTMCG